MKNYQSLSDESLGRDPPFETLSPVSSGHSFFCNHEKSYIYKLITIGELGNRLKKIPKLSDEESLVSNITQWGEKHLDRKDSDSDRMKALKERFENCEKGIDEFNKKLKLEESRAERRILLIKGILSYCEDAIRILLEFSLNEENGDIKSQLDDQIKVYSQLFEKLLEEIANLLKEEEKTFKDLSLESVIENYLELISNCAKIFILNYPMDQRLRPIKTLYIGYVYGRAENVGEILEKDLYDDTISPEEYAQIKFTLSYIKYLMIGNCGDWDVAMDYIESSRECYKAAMHAKGQFQPEVSKPELFFLTWKLIDTIRDSKECRKASRDKCINELEKEAYQLSQNVLPEYAEGKKLQYRENKEKRIENKIGFNQVSGDFYAMLGKGCFQFSFKKTYKGCKNYYENRADFDNDNEKYEQFKASIPFPTLVGEVSFLTSSAFYYKKAIGIFKGLSVNTEDKELKKRLDAKIEKCLKSYFYGKDQIIKLYLGYVELLILHKDVDCPAFINCNLELALHSAERYVLTHPFNLKELDWEDDLFWQDSEWFLEVARSIQQLNVKESVLLSAEDCIKRADVDYFNTGGTSISLTKSWLERSVYYYKKAIEHIKPHEGDLLKTAQRRLFAFCSILINLKRASCEEDEDITEIKDLKNQLAEKICSSLLLIGLKGDSGEITEIKEPNDPFSVEKSSSTKIRANNEEEKKECLKGGDDNEEPEPKRPGFSS
jgi:hypothetical protein